MEKLGVEPANGNGTATKNQKFILGIPCEGCTQRAEIMGAGNWQIDAMILTSMALLVIGIILYKTSIKNE